MELSVSKPSEENPMVKSDHLPSVNGNRAVLHENGRARVALPMAYIESCTSKVQQDFLWRFFEAWQFSEGHICAVNADGEPQGRYAAHADAISPSQYTRLEVDAFRWVRQYDLGQEWAMIAELFLRMMSDRTDISMIDWGRARTNCFDEKVALGGAQVTVGDLGFRLKDAYRNFFRWYKYVTECEQRDREPTGDGAMKALQREKAVADQIQEFRARYRHLRQED